MKESMQTEQIKIFYGELLSNASDLKTSACCLPSQPSKEVAETLANIHPEVSERFFGCGLIAPEFVKDCTVLDLGCGSGRDAFLLSKLVGSKGKVIGLDMTDAQLDYAKKHLKYHTSLFGYEQPNIEFRKGYIEQLEGIADESVDLVVSNCVINLSPRKDLVFKEIFRVLKPGGELYFSDVFVDRRLSTSLSDNPLLVRECLGGAMYLEDFRRILAVNGIFDYRVLSENPIEILDASMKKLAAGAQFSSMTIRAFKISFEDKPEDYGQMAYFLDDGEEFQLDVDNIFKSKRPRPISGNTARILTQSRLKSHFKVYGDESYHRGSFLECRIKQSKFQEKIVTSESCC